MPHISSDFFIIIVRGDTPTLEFQFLDADTHQPLNLSGWTLYFMAKTADGIVFIDKQMTVTDPLNGKAQVALTSTETNYVGRHDAEVEARKDLDIMTLGQGILIIKGDIRP